jgi:hypothetical protein
VNEVAKMKDAFSGAKFGRLIVVRQIEDRIFGGKKRHFFLCRCECGSFADVCIEFLGTHTKSCGCYKKELASVMNLRHGLYKHRLYSVWHNMKHRCQYQKDIHFKDYGGRGIRVCEEWNDFLAFYSWACLNGYKDNLTLDRIDNDGNYEPNNCRWITMLEQSRPGGKRLRKDILFIEYKGECLSSMDWSKRLGAKYNIVLQRLNRGWDSADAINNSL